MRHILLRAAILGAVCFAARAAEVIPLVQTPYVLPFAASATFSFAVPEDADAVHLTIELRVDVAECNQVPCPCK